MAQNLSPRSKFGEKPNQLINELSKRRALGEMSMIVRFPAHNTLNFSVPRDV